MNINAEGRIRAWITGPFALYNQALAALLAALPGIECAGTSLLSENTPSGRADLILADEAEFTPTNVQTKEDCARLVYAVVIGLDNPDSPAGAGQGLALKPGMIADVEFISGGSQ